MNATDGRPTISSPRPLVLSDGAARRRAAAAEKLEGRTPAQAWAEACDLEARADDADQRGDRLTARLSRTYAMELRVAARASATREQIAAKAVEEAYRLLLAAGAANPDIVGAIDPATRQLREVVAAITEGTL